VGQPAYGIWPRDTEDEAVELMGIWGVKTYYDWLVVTGTMEFYDFPFSWEFHHPN
jgi:hypothetical protein